MTDFETYILDLCSRKESCDIEFKSAKGGFPQSFWESYSAFGNTDGGIIVLGVKEKNHQFFPDGLDEKTVADYKKAFWDLSHNKNKVSVSLLSESDVFDGVIDGKSIIVFSIPRAPYSSRPVYLTLNPFGGNTYKRNHEGDYQCSDEEVRQMFIDAQIETSPYDGHVIDYFSIEDNLSADTVSRYRSMFEERHPNHPWLKLDNEGFLTKIGAIDIDPSTKKKGITFAGVMVFGTEQSILHVAPYYFVDYREKMFPGKRWTDRVWPDGNWDSNLFEFYYRVYPKLAQALPVPFKLEGDARVDETPAHESLREALCNTLVHAALYKNESIVIERYPEKIIFTNPGSMLISVDEYFAGGRSVCRNPKIQRIFALIGRGERAGSGADTIAYGWNENHWPKPQIKELVQPDRVELTLLLTSVEKRVETGEETSAKRGAEKTSEKILKVLKNNKFATAKEVAAQIGISESGVEKQFARLKKSGKIKREGGDFGGYWEVISE